MASISIKDQLDPIPLITSNIQCKKKKRIDKSKKNLNNFFEILKKYQQWLQIFENDKTKNALLQHKSWDYEIPLKLNMELMFKFI